MDGRRDGLVVVVIVVVVSSSHNNYNNYNISDGGGLFDFKALSV